MKFVLSRLFATHLHNIPVPEFILDFAHGGSTFVTKLPLNIPLYKEMINNDLGYRAVR